MSALQMVPLEEGEMPHAGPMCWVKCAGVSPDGMRTEAVVEIDEGFSFLRDGAVMEAAWMEMMAQTAAAGWAIAGRASGRRVKHGYLAAVAEYHVHDVVNAGAQVKVCAVHEKTFGKLARGRFAVFNGKVLVADARMTFFVEFE